MASKRAMEWIKFSHAVLDHIESYTVPQYGDEGEDLASNYTVQRCLEQVEKYLKRAGRNRRQGQDRLDLMKMAHYTQMAWRLLEQEDGK